ncbi:hypothetical protein LSH36_111g03008 [Paralvinella palmiformis]|uniref:EF-hand domain-containing protein n=1 Tax=Paralvinella palmiformis TaxID=53620 RepID=A0AAD9JYC2_9ANNE|nr:hypothetical protein LSH36_111g03008 [Paralvinella palmiformis]
MTLAGKPHWYSRKAAEGLSGSVIRLDHMRLRPMDARTLAIAMVCNDTVTTLQLPGNRIGPEGVKCICDMLSANTTLQELETSYLRHLNISHNEFREEGGIKLANALVGNMGLESLDLSWNHLRLKGAVALALSLKENVSLRSLIASWNGFANDGAKAIGAALKVNMTLTVLDLSCNRINLEGSIAIAEGLRKNESLKVLQDIEVNPAFEELLEEVRLEHQIEVIHGGRVSHADPYATRVGRKIPATPGDPLALLLAHVKKSSLRLMDFFAQLDKDNSMSVSKSEFKKGMKVRSLGEISSISGPLSNMAASTSKLDTLEKISDEEGTRSES